MDPRRRCFREAVALYLGKLGEPSVRALLESETAREGLEAMLRLTARFVSQPGKPHGCLLVLGAVNCSPASRAPQEHLRTIRRRAPKVIRQRLDRAVAEGELPRGLDTAGIAAFHATVVHGLGVRAGDGASQAALMAAVDGAMAACDVLTAGRSRGRRALRRTSPGTGRRA